MLFSITIQLIESLNRRVQMPLNRRLFVTTMKFCVVNKELLAKKTYLCQKFAISTFSP